MGGAPQQIGVLCPLCAHFVPFSEIEGAYVIEDMVGTSGFEPLTSTVSR
jgi:hypothetical protein